MIYPPIGAAGYKAPMESGSIARKMTPAKAVTTHVPTRDTFSTQTPLVVIGLAAIGMIILINSHARPTPVREKTVAYACSECGTVVAVRRAADSPMLYIIDVQMLDGSLRAIPQLAASFSVGDIVRVNGAALTLRAAAS